MLIQTSFVSAYVSLSFSATTIPSSVEPGQKANVLITITNAGNEAATNLNLNVKSSQYVTVENQFFSVGSLNPSGSTTITVPVTILRNSPEGSTSIPITANYNVGTSAGTISSDNSVIIKITRRPLLQVVYTQYDKEVIQKGNTVTMTIGLQNKGGGRIKDLTVALRNFTLPIVPADTDTEKIYSSLESGQILNISFNLFVNQNAQTIVYSVPITVSFYDEQGTLYTDTKYSGLKVSGVPDFVVSLERLDNFFQGTKGRASITIANRGSGTAYFLTAYSTSDLNLEPTVSYIGNLDPDDTSSLVLDSNLGEASKGIHKLNVTLLYKDSYNEQFSKEYLINLDVQSKPFEMPLIVQVVIVVVALILSYLKRNEIKKIVLRK